MESSLFITACSNLNMVLLKFESSSAKNTAVAGSNLNMVLLKYGTTDIAAGDFIVLILIWYY